MSTAQMTADTQIPITVNRTISAPGSQLLSQYQDQPPA
jgi:hypothetical protein